MKENAVILDACCGGKMFYFDKSDERVLFQDIRSFETTLCDGRPFSVHPDVQADFTDMPYPDNSFSMVVLILRIYFAILASRNLQIYMEVLIPKLRPQVISKLNTELYQTTAGVNC